MKLKVLVRTPKNQAPKSVNTLKHNILGIKGSKKVIEQKVLSHKLFYWIITIKNDKDMEHIVKKCARGEIIIRKFYRTIFKLINRANKLSQKFKKGTGWAKEWIKRQLRKYGNENQDIQDYIDQTTEDHVNDLIKITDREEMDKLLAGDLITVKRLEE